MSSDEIINIRKRLFIKIKFNNLEVKYNKLSISEKFNLISNIIRNNITKISKQLKITNIIFEKTTPFTNIIFFTVYTLPNRNHPLIGFVSKANNTSEITLIRPIGKKRYNLDIDKLDIYLNRYKNHWTEELYGLYLSIIKSIVIRKEELLLNDEFSLLNCHNIKGCITATKKLSNKSLRTKKQQITLFRNNAIKVIINYFNELEKYKFSNAEEILGTSKDSISLINNIFKKNKKIRGHLEIFITLYKLIKNIKEKYNSLINKIISKKTNNHSHNFIKTKID
jgi:hypothetical protein